MKIIVTHASPDIDAITAVWLIKKFLPDWADAKIEFVQAGERIQRLVNKRLASILQDQRTKRYTLNATETIEKDEYIHVDTGLGALDHHQIEDESVSSASLTWELIKNQISHSINLGQAKIKYQKEETNEKWEIKKKAVDRMVKVVTEIDHFGEVFWENPTADRYEFMLSEIIEGLKLAKPNQDEYYIDLTMKTLDAILHNFENRIWAEKEISENGIEFETSFGKGIGFETLNDSVLKLAQKMNYVLVVRKDPRKGYVRVKARPSLKSQNSKVKTQKDKGVDLTIVYEKLKKMDPNATWFLHVSKKMLLNGTTKNPKMKPTILSLGDIIKVLKEI